MYAEISKAISTKFILLSFARTGSNYLMSMLSAHPNIKMNGEIFNLDGMKDDQLRAALLNPVKYLNDLEDRCFSDTVSVTGFKMFYDHMTFEYFDKLVDLSDAAERLRNKYSSFKYYMMTNYEPCQLTRSFSDVWNELKNERSRKVIHLKRRNKLAVLASLKLAYKTTRWMSIKSLPITNEKLFISSEECLRFFQKLKSYENEFDKTFKNHSLLNVNYESVIDNTEMEMKRIYGFLNLEYIPIKTILKKQITCPLNQLIVNYEELKNGFYDTEWQSYFS